MTDEDITKIMRDKELATCHEAFDTYGIALIRIFAVRFNNVRTKQIKTIARNG